MVDQSVSPLRFVVRTFLRICFRLYVLGVIALVGWLSYRALRYLVVSLMFASPPPDVITKLPTRMDAALLRTPLPQWAALTATANPRSPVTHYHHLDGWFQPDTFNGCTQSGCHTPMPHNARKEVRAFLNMHATSIHCGVCHMETEALPLPLTWYSLRNGRSSTAPALLRAYEWLVCRDGRESLANPTKAVQDKLVGLLRTAAADSDGDPVLTRLAEEIGAIRHTSDMFQTLVETARTQVPLRFHGAYGAKLALGSPDTGQPILGYPNTADAIADFLQRSPTAESHDRDAMLKKVHVGQRAESLQCTTCHREDEGLVDLSTVGYPPARIASLTKGWIFRAIEDIAAGLPLYLPEFTSPNNRRESTSAPSADQP